MFFHHIGKMKMETGFFKVVKQVDLKLLEAQIAKVDVDIKNFEISCECGTSLFSTQVKKMSHDLNSIFSLMGSYHRNRRGINFIGSGLKWMFGTMDNDDSEYIQDVLQDVGDRQDRLHSTVDETVHVMKNLSKQWELLRENQQIQVDNFNNLKNAFDSRYDAELKFEWGIENDNVKLHLDSLILSVQVQIDKLRTAILFLKTGVVDPYLIDPEELSNILTIERLGYAAGFGDVGILIENSRPIVVFDSINKVIHIVLRIPIAKDDEFNLYENIVVPKIVNSSIFVIDSVPKYVAFANNNSIYVDSNLFKCIWVSGICITDRTAVYSVLDNRNCMTEIFTKSIDSLCQYRELKVKFQAHDVVNVGFILFSAVNISVDLTCGNYSDSQVLNNSYLIIPPLNCNVTSSFFSFEGESNELEVDLVNVIPSITCCSNYYKNVSISNVTDPLVLRSLHDIQGIDIKSIDGDLKLWSKFRKVDFRGGADKYKWHFTTLLIIIIIIVVSAMKFGVLGGRGTNNNVTVRFQAVMPGPAEDHSRYPIL